MAVNTDIVMAKQVVRLLLTDLKIDNRVPEKRRDKVKCMHFSYRCIAIAYSQQ